MLDMLRSGLTRCCSAVCPTTKNRRLRCTADTRSEGRCGGLAVASAALPPPVEYVMQDVMRSTTTGIQQQSLERPCDNVVIWKTQQPQIGLWCI